MAAYNYTKYSATINSYTMVRALAYAKISLKGLWRMRGYDSESASEIQWDAPIEDTAALYVRNAGQYQPVNISRIVVLKEPTP